MTRRDFVHRLVLERLVHLVQKVSQEFVTIQDLMRNAEAIADIVEATEPFDDAPAPAGSKRTGVDVEACVRVARHLGDLADAFQARDDDYETLSFDANGASLPVGILRMAKRAVS